MPNKTYPDQFKPWLDGYNVAIKYFPSGADVIASIEANLAISKMIQQGSNKQ